MMEPQLNAIKKEHKLLIIMSTPVLRFFYQSAEVRFRTDASFEVLGALIEQSEDEG